MTPAGRVHNAGGRADPIAGGNEQIRRRPDDSRSYRDDIMGTGWLTESGDLGTDVEIAIEDHAPKVREVQRAVAGDAVVQRLLRDERREQHRTEKVDVDSRSNGAR